MVIAIDGPAGSGKTTTANKVAKLLQFVHINTGAMYRGITLKLIHSKIDYRDIKRVERMFEQTTFEFAGNDSKKLFMDGNDVSFDILSTEITESVSVVSTNKYIRESMVNYQREMVRGLDAVLEGRDIGTVVFPKADFKFFLIADVYERAKRRKKEMESTGDYFSLEEIITKLNERDKIDSHRKYSPLIKADDAIQIDTTHLSIDQQVDEIINVIHNLIK